MPIAPWLQPPDFLGAMRSGAGLGLQIASQRSADQQAAARLRQAQESLFMQQQQQAQAAAERAQEFEANKQAQAASLALQDRRYQDTLDERAGEASAKLAQSAADAAERAGYKEEASKQAQAAQALRERHQTYLEKLAETKNDPENAQLQVQEIGDQKFAVNPKTGHFQLLNKEDKGPATSPNVFLAYGRELKKTIADPEASDEEKANARAQLAEANKKLRSLLSPDAPAVVPVITKKPWYKGGGMETNFAPAAVVGPSATPLPPVDVAPAEKPRTKPEIARELSAANPDWDKARVIEEVNKLFSRQ